MHTIVWRFTVKPEAVAEFETHYAGDGSWARLFRQAKGYRGTDLLRVTGRTDVYVTFDYWESEADFQAFQAALGADYKALDARCENLTLHEEKLGVITSGA